MDASSYSFFCQQDKSCENEKGKSIIDRFLTQKHLNLVRMNIYFHFMALLFVIFNIRKINNNWVNAVICSRYDCVDNRVIYSYFFVYFLADVLNFSTFSKIKKFEFFKTVIIRTF